MQHRKGAARFSGVHGVPACQLPDAAVGQNDPQQSIAEVANRHHATQHLAHSSYAPFRQCYPSASSLKCGMFVFLTCGLERQHSR